MAQEPQSLEELREKYAKLYAENPPQTQEPSNGPGMTIEQHVEAASELARNYQPSEYLKTAPIGKPYKGQ